MNDCNEFKRRPGETNCGISDEQFPMLQKCCSYSGVGAHQKYKSICPFCKACALPPTGENLEVATIFECGQYGYCRRVKE
jgi:hypothetical protein